MLYYSTKGKTKPVTFRQAVLQGLPADNGLFMPERIPRLDKDHISHLRSAGLPEIGYDVSRIFVDGEIDDAILKDLVQDAVNFEAPVVNIKPGISVLELFHGPTLAFKDFGGRFMARIMGHFVRNSDKELNILVATSGDTGGAVASGFFKVPGITVTILFPKGKVSPLQEKQLTTWGENINAVEIKGNFDDCQEMVKRAFLDDDINKHLTLTSANSINISRLIPQSFYYFSAAGHFDSPPVFSVPSGNFGNLCGGLLAWRLGLPVEKFIAAVNANDAFPDFLKTGNFQPRPSVPTISNAMDVGNPSNLVRVVEFFNNDIEKIKSMVWSAGFTDSETADEMRDLFLNHNYLSDPHTSVGMLGFKTYSKLFNNHSPGVILSTAHAAKFQDVVETRINDKVELPDSLSRLKNQQGHKQEMNASFEDFKEYLIFRNS